MKFFFQRAKVIEANIDKYLDNIDSAALIFELAVKEYCNDQSERFEKRSEELDKLEGECDDLRRDIKYTLYKELLIPDARGDVVGLIETLDNVVDTIKKVAYKFSIETPANWPFLRNDFIELVETVSKAVRQVVIASRAFFREVTMVSDHITQVHFWEHEADAIEERIMRKAFASAEIEKFSMKVHMRYFAEKISLVADEAESVAERLSVYAIKRNI